MSVLVKSYTEGRAEIGVELKNAQIIRKIKDNAWTTLRIGVRYSFWNDPGVAPTAGALFAVGLCNGSTNCIADATTNHFVGYGNWGTTGAVIGYTRTAGAGFYYNNPTVGGIASNFGVIENGVWRDSTVIAALTNRPTNVGPNVGSGAWACSVLAFDITRTGGTGFTLAIKCHRTAVTTPDVTAATFEAQLEAASMSITDHIAYAGGACTLDEVTYGALDHFNLWWNRSSPSMFIHDIGVVRLA